MTDTRVFCAVDTTDLDAALALAGALDDLPLGLKLGLEFFVAQGPAGIRAVRDAAGAKRELFLDLKLHDIPNTVAGAVRAAVPLGVDYITLHTGGGVDMMRAAQDAAREEAVKHAISAPKLLGVTVLTSLSDDDLEKVGQIGPALEQVERLATLAEMAGLAGIVCSPREIAHLRKMVRPDFMLVVPGIRPAGAAAGDQKRVMTPEEAATRGADRLVIGRPITQAENPAAAARAILDGIATAQAA